MKICVVALAGIAGIAGCDSAADAAAAEEAEIAEAREHGKRVAQEYIAEARARGELPEQQAAEPEGPGQVVAPLPGAPGTPGALEATVEGDLDRDLIRRVVRAHIGDVRDCYNAGLVKNAELAGKIAVRFTITAEGKARDASVAESSLADATVEGCISGAVGRWIFPRPGEGEVVVVYPFELSPG